MRILLISDTHGKRVNLKTVIERVRPDAIYHMGDGEGDEDYIRSVAGCPLEIVRGNCDYGSDLPTELVLSVGRHVVMLTHGHLYHVNSGTEMLEEAARQKGADAVVYGHTHCPEVIYREGMMIVNPGSLSLPRQDGRKPSFVLLDVDKAGDLHFALNYL